MKFLPSQLAFFIHDKRARRNVRSLFKFLVFLAVFITLYSVLFHMIMLMEGQEHSWVTGFYWTLTVMSTLGFGDITFSSDLGRVFSLVVLLSGIVFLLVMLPFTFIQFFYAPFLEAQSTSRVRRDVPEGTSGHLIIIGLGRIALSLVPRLRNFNYPYYILVGEVQEALDLLDQGYSVVLGSLDDPDTYKRLQVSDAAMVVTLSDDMKNTNASFTIREVSPDVPIIANAEMEESVDILQLAGATHVFQFMKMLGEILARRTLCKGKHYNRIGRFDDLVIAEVPAMRTPLVGKTILDSGLREETGMSIVGVWNRGRIEPPMPETVINANSVLILAGSEEQLDACDTYIHKQAGTDTPVLVLGGGRVGRAAALALQEQGVTCRIVEKNPRHVRDDLDYVIGNASDLDTLVQAGINKAPAVIITTHTDDMNIYLTIYCRRLRPDIQIICRATLDRNITVLHTAGADLVMSYATLAANTVLNLLQPEKVLMLTEGLNIFRHKTPAKLAGATLIESGIRQQTGCNVIALHTEEGMSINPGPETVIDAMDDLILIGSAENERRFIDAFMK